MSIELHVNDIMRHTIQTRLTIFKYFYNLNSQLIAGTIVQLTFARYVVNSLNPSTPHECP